MAAPWEDATSATIGSTAEWTNKVELADVDGDGRVDLLFANGAGYSTPGSAQQNRVFLNVANDQPFVEASEDVFGNVDDFTRVIKVRDLDGDDNVGIVVGNTFVTRSRLLLGDGMGGYTDVTDTNFPALDRSIGDIEAGDVDDDGDVDLVLSDWGEGNALENAGGRTMLWLNDGTGAFSDATASNMPDLLVRFSWELELVDVDNDWDLDVLVSCKSCTGSFMFENDGSGVFADVSDRMPQAPNNYEFEAIDLNGDGALDLVTINDGSSLSERILINDGSGTFTDETATLWSGDDNPTNADDNMVVFLDYESDGDADVLIGSLDHDDRVLLNDGNGLLVLQSGAFTGTSTPGTLGIAAADLDEDGRLDVVQAQGEVADPEKVFLGVDIPTDTAAPIIGNVKEVAGAVLGASIELRARVHDNKSPVMSHDFSSVEVRHRVDGGAPNKIAMEHYGEYLWCVFRTIANTKIGASRTRRSEHREREDRTIANTKIGPS